MSKRKKLFKIAQLLEEYLNKNDLKEKEPLRNQIENKFDSIFYANTSELLIGSKKLEQIKKKESFLDNAKITRKAKLIIKDNFVSFELVKNAENSIFSFFDNNLLHLIPEISIIKEIVTEESQKISESIWEENAFSFQACFLQGKQNYKNLNKVKVEEYLNDEEDNKFYDALSSLYKRNILGYVNNNYKKAIINSLENSYSYFNELSDIKEIISNQSQIFYQNLNDFIKNELIKIYSMGNLYQIKKDGNKYVTLLAASDEYDCKECKDIQCDEKILNAEFVLEGSYICYDLDDIITKSLYQGNDFLTHKGCRCQFIPISIE